MPKLKTNEEFLKEVQDTIPTIEILEKYKNNHTKIKCKCLIHNEICYSTPKRLLNGHNCCPSCISEEKSNRLKFDNQKLLELLKEHDITDVIPLEEYHGMNEKMKFRCSCGDIWETTPHRVIIGNHCKKCGNKKKLGENNHFYNPNLTDEERHNAKQRFRNPKYKNFIKECFDRDDYTCQISGLKSHGDIVVHHINGYNWDVENRFNIDNGITLNEEIHKEFHKMYGKGNNTKEQFSDFLKMLLNRGRISKEKFEQLLKRLDKIE